MAIFQGTSGLMVMEAPINNYSLSEKLLVPNKNLQGGLCVVERAIKHNVCPCWTYSIKEGVTHMKQYLLILFRSLISCHFRSF